ncbi:MAG TPA: hypothetical protein VL086_16595 [Candidatus Nitrosotalea sp.]|nr:hypothetical protein [Candidatus Nitrosotalea sp.]
MPNSERQPDGRWLPVAELAANHRGVVTPKPPLRAAPRETRATRADADTVAVKMAKAWIETIEREETSSAPANRAEARALTGAPRPSAPIGNTVASPRIPSEPRGQDARAEAPPRARGIEPKKRPTPADTLDWPGLLEAIGDRFTRLLAVHALLDRLVTQVLAAKLAADIEPILDALASLPMASRVALASTVNAIPPAAAEAILEIDRARHRLVHSKPTRGKPTWDVSGAVESLSRDAWDKSLRKGLEAAQDLMSALRAAAQET